MNPWKISRCWRQTGSSRPMVLAAALAAILLIAGLGFLAFYLQKGAPPPPTGAPVAREAGQAPSGNSVEVTDPGKVVARPAAEAPATPSADTGQAAAPAPGATISGTVRVAGTSRPAPGMKVVVRRETPGDSDIAARFKEPKLEAGDLSSDSAADGSYRIEGIPPGEHRAFALRGETSYVDISPLKGKRLTVGPDLAAQTIDFEVVVGGTIYGKVLDGEGNPVREAKVTVPSLDFLSAVFDSDSGFHFNETTSKEDGSYRVTGLPIEKRYMAIAETKDKAKEVSDEIAFTPDEMEVEVDLILLPGSTVSGRVVEASGAPVPRMETRLMAQSTNLLLLEPRSSLTGDSGEFVFERVRAGSYTLSAGPGGAQVITEEVECDGETEVADLVLVLPEGETVKGGLSGRVVDDGGNGIPGVKLQVIGFVATKGPINQASTSGADGTFAFQGLPEGSFNLTAAHDDYASYMQMGVAPGTAPIEVRLSKAGRIRGTVLTKSGEPVAGALIKVTPLSKDITDFNRFIAGQLPGQLPAVKSASDGTFTAEKVMAGSNRLQAEATGFAPASVVIEVTPGQRLEGLEVVVSEGGSIGGLVLSPDGKPVADARISAAEASDNPWEEQVKKFMPGGIGGGGVAPGARAEDDGTFKVKHLQGAKFHLVATHESFSPSEELEVVLKADEKREGIKLRLRKLSNIRVRVREKDKPIPDLMVQVMGPGPMKMSSTDGDGKSEFTSLTPGDYLVQALDLAKMMSGQGLGIRQKAVHLDEGQSADLDFIAGIGAKVHGKVIGKLGGSMNVIVIHRPEAPKAEEMEITDLQSSFRAAQYNVAMGIIAADGNYTISDVPDGEFILEVPRVPADFSKMAQMTPQERMPHYRKPLKIEGGRDVTVPDIRIRADQGASDSETKPPEPPASPPGE
jgi:carboxypeptidase family protein